MRAAILTVARAPVDFARFMGDYLLFTQTQWSEAPRIRHQVARLLLDAGHRVIFFERPDNPFSAQPASAVEIEPRLWLVQTTKLLHHQLRLVPPMHWANAWVTVRSIRQRLHELQATLKPAPDAQVFNFAHDYYFLRRIFPKNRIVTIIHDDFEAQSRMPFTGHIGWSLKRTCQMSDEVFAVSTPLQERCSQFHPTKLLLPWSVVPYRAPHARTQDRDILAYWGFVDVAIDLDVVRALSAHLLKTRPTWRVLLIGPTQSNRRQIMIDGVADCPNVAVQERTNLDALPLDRMLGALVPYRRSKAMNSVMLANKSMQLLARGLPLLISGMPAFIERPFIQRLDGPGGPAAAVDECVKHFNDWQPAIQKFVQENSPESRMDMLGITRAAGAVPRA